TCLRPLSVTPSPASKAVPHDGPTREPPPRPWGLDPAVGARRGAGAVRVRLPGRADRHRRVHRRRDGCAVSALSAVQSAIVRLFRSDMAIAAGLPEDPPPTLAETLARLDEMHARVQEMIAAAPPRTERTRAGDREEGETK